MRDDAVKFLTILHPSEDQQARLNGLLAALAERLSAKTYPGEVRAKDDEINKKGRPEE